VLQRTYRIWDRLKLKVVICRARPADELVDWHEGSGEGHGRLCVEGPSEQILEVVAIMIKTLSRVHPLD